MIGYVRVSTTDQAANGVSLDEQERRIRGYGTAHGLDVIRIERDDGISAKTTTNRPALLRALRALKRRKASGLVVVKLDRLSRSLQDVLDLVARAEREKWELHSIGENLDTSTPYGRFVVHLFAALAQLEREQIGERTRNGMAELRRQGKRISRHAPFGFAVSGGELVPRGIGAAAPEGDAETTGRRLRPRRNCSHVEPASASESAYRTDMDPLQCRDDPGRSLRTSTLLSFSRSGYHTP